MLVFERERERGREREREREREKEKEGEGERGREREGGEGGRERERGRERECSPLCNVGGRIYYHLSFSPLLPPPSPSTPLLGRIVVGSVRPCESVLQLLGKW